LSWIVSIRLAAFPHRNIARIEKATATHFWGICKPSATISTGVKTGDLMAHATNDVQNIRMAVGYGNRCAYDASCSVRGNRFHAYIHIRLTIFALIHARYCIGYAVFSKIMHRSTRMSGVIFRFDEAARERFAGIRITKPSNGKKIRPPG
jgi:ATP-binding cassette subfamily B protein